MRPFSHLAEVAWVFLRLGALSFGGPAAHIALMEAEVVSRRGWLDRQRFLDLIGATNLIPGPNSTEMAMHCGRERAGIAGLFAAGLCFILPSLAATALLAWAYGRYGGLPVLQPAIGGAQAAVLAIIASAGWKLGQKAFQRRELMLLGLGVFAAALAGLHEIALLLGAGLLWAFWQAGRGGASRAWAPALLLQAPAMAQALPGPGLFWIFLKIGATLYGSGYVLFSYLDAELVSRGLLDRAQLADIVAAGQLTPGPVLSSALMAGQLLAGWPGALLAALGIFLPSFLFVLLLGPLLDRLKGSRFFRAFLDAVNAASVALIAAVLWQMGLDTLGSWQEGLIALASAGLLFFRPGASPLWALAGGALAGALLGGAPVAA